MELRRGASLAQLGRRGVIIAMVMALAACSEPAIDRLKGLKVAHLAPKTIHASVVQGADFNHLWVPDGVVVMCMF